MPIQQKKHFFPNYNVWSGFNRKEGRESDCVGHLYCSQMMKEHPYFFPYFFTKPRQSSKKATPLKAEGTQSINFLDF